ncbi:MAG: hypothetical protein Q4Q53_00530 [Methanocorpusculum sp.]|nr:hypothetical protein [Methanocorpusculum sp.]
MSEELLQADKIVGTWKGLKSVPFLASGEFTITFLKDNTARASGSLRLLGQTHKISVDTIFWLNKGENNYVGEYDGEPDKKVGFSLDKVGNRIMANINPYKLGVVNNPRFNMDISVDLHRV